MGVTRKDVASLAGVSTATVSYVVNSGPRPVSAETRRKVERAIEQLGYQPNQIARSLTTKRTNTLGFLIPDILNPIHAAMAKSFEDALPDNEYGLLLANSDESPVVELEHLKVFISKQVDGIAMTPTGGNRRFLFSLVESGKPLVLLDRQLEGMETDCVLFDNVEGTYQAVRHLVELGHSRIALINLPQSLTPGRERAEGYGRALLKAGLTVDLALVREGRFKADSVATLLESLLQKDPPPTALMVASNRLLEGVLQYVKEHGIRIPDDLALCVFDDVSHFSYSNPTITAVAADVADFSRRAAQMLLERIAGEGPHGPRIIRILCTLRIRESTFSL